MSSSSSEPSKRRGWTDPSTLAHLAAFVTAIAALIASCQRPTPPELKADKVYEALKTQIEATQAANRQTSEDLRDLRAWLKGYFAATGTKVPDPPGASATTRHVTVATEPATASSVAPVVIAPSRTGAAPVPQSVRVLTPLPAPKPAPTPEPLPAKADAL